MTSNPDEQEVRAQERHRLVGPPDLWAMKRRFQIEFLLAQGLRREDRLLDLGCGTLRGGIPLIEYLQPRHYTGIDVRPAVLDEARCELAEAGLAHKEPALVAAGRLADLTLAERFDVVWSFAVLIHMHDDILHEALDLVARHLADDQSRFFATVHLGQSSGGNWQGFPIVSRPWEFYRAAFQDHGLRVTDIGSLREHGHDHPRLPLERQERQRMLMARKA